MEPENVFQLINHLDFDHEEIKLPRKTKFENEEELYMKHYISASDFYAKNPDACDRCCWNIGTPEKLLEHKNKWHPGWEIPYEAPVYDKKEYIYKCIYCTGAFRVEEDLVYHREDWHENKEKLRRHRALRRPNHCNTKICAKIFETREQLWKHRSLDHSDFYGKLECLNKEEYKDFKEEEIHGTIEELQKMLNNGLYTDEFVFDKTPFITVDDGFKDVARLRHKCNHCSGAFQQEHIMMYHLYICHPEQKMESRPTYFCDRCPMRFGTESALNFHQYETYEEGLDKRTGKRSWYGVMEVSKQRREHYISEEDFYTKFPGACNKCFSNFDTAELMLEHKSEKHPGWEHEEKPKVYADDEYTFYCQEKMCYGAFLLEQDLIYHQQKVHPKQLKTENVIFCNKCSYEYFHETSKFLAHSQQRHDGTATAVPRMIKHIPSGGTSLLPCEKESDVKTGHAEKDDDTDSSFEIV